MAQNNNVKKLTVAELKKQGKKLDVQKEFTVKIDDTEYKLSCDLIFKKSKQFELLDDISEFFNVAMENENTKLLDLATPYISLLIIKHFTSLEVPDGVEETMPLLNVLIDLDLLGAILEELPEDELVKLFELIQQATDKVTEDLQGYAKEADKVLGEIQDEEIRKEVEKYLENEELEIEDEEVVADGQEDL